MNAIPVAHDVAYERKAVLLLTLGFGLVGLDRWIIAPLFPSILKDLNLNYQDLGNIVGVLGLAWGVCAVFAGGLSDRFGRKTVLVPAIVAFSVLSGLSGMATGLASLILLRTLMGAAEGAFCPTSFATTNDASKPSRRGFNLGIQQSTFPLFGLAIGPILATQLLQVTSWRMVLVVVALPGLVIAALLAMTIREPATIGKSSATARAPLSHIFSHRNVGLGMVALLCAMSGIFTISAMVPSYLVDYLKFSTQQMGFVTSAIGVGGCLGQLGLTGASDVIGRKLTAIIGFACATAFLYAFAHAVNPVALFILLLVTCFFCFGLLGVITGPIAAEAAPIGLVASTAGIIIGSGEIFGGGVAPVVAGAIAQRWGIQHTLTMALAGLALGILVSLFLLETAPRKARVAQLAT